MSTQRHLASFVPSVASFKRWRSALAGIMVLGAVLISAVLPAQKASAYVCNDNGLGCDIGYFSLANLAAGSHHNLYYGNDWSWGGNPFLLGLRAYDINGLTSLIGGRMACTNGAQPGNTWLPNPSAQNATSAAFTVLTMLGAPPGTPKNAACDRYREWETIVRQYDAAGLIHYDEWHGIDGVNTRLSYNAGTDVTYYADFDPPSSTSIVFYSPNGSGPLYAIKHDCGNPIGRLRALTPLGYTMQANVSVNPGTVEPGQSITFTMGVSTFGSQRPTDPNISCRIYEFTRPGYVTNPAPGGGDPSHTVPCGPYPPNISVTLETDTINNVAANTSYCRYLVVQPANQNGGTVQQGACAQVVSKPYAKVFGGDVSAGSDFGTSCTIDRTGSVVGWNLRQPNFAGAGTQYGAFVLGTLFDFSTSQGTGTAAKPSGLAFANQGITAVQQNAGTFGSGLNTLPCTADYYGQKPASATVVAGPLNAGSLGSGAYVSNGNLILSGGIINPNQRTTLYVNGNLHIDGDVTYAGAWNSDSIPLFQVIVRGSIYIDNDVTQLSGVYVAQRNAAGAAGVIYTCATVSSGYTALPLDDSLYNTCNKKLTVNGSFTANQVELLRTYGTQLQSTAGDGSGAAAEVFNFNPAFWIAQPTPGSATGGSGAQGYDSVVSLPPVL